MNLESLDWEVLDRLRTHSSAVVRETAAQAMTRLRLPGHTARGVLHS